MHSAEKIINQLQVLLNGLSSVAHRVYQNRVYAITETPAINLKLGSDSVIKINPGFIDNELQLIIAVHVKAQEVEILGEVLSIRSAVHQAIMQAPSLGLPFVIDCVPIAMSEPQINGEADSPTCQVNLEWKVLYRHPINSPEVT